MIGAAASDRERFLWIYALLAAPCSEVLTEAVKLIGVRMGLHFSGKTGLCNPSARALACETACDERTAERATAGLRQLGWISIVGQGGGRGRSNRYALLMAHVPAETPARQTVINPETPARRPSNPGAPVPKPRHAGRGNVEKVGTMLAQASENLFWVKVKELLTEHIGEVKFEAWFKDVLCGEISDDEVCLLATTKFFAARIVRDYETQLQDAWREVLGRQVRVKVSPIETEARRRQAAA
jgi:DnaA N-terminal domain/Helix-turn-helix domain